MEGQPFAPLAISEATALISTIEGAVNQVLLGQEDVVRQVLVGLLAGGHILLEGPPGLGKTLLARTLARVLGVRFTRIQFTPDLMPSDITGGNIFNQREDDFVFREGPIFTQILLADEINRAPAKTQAALLEAMSDRQVTVDGATRELPRPFFTIATQNPVESEGTYPLPEAQLDRFMLKVLVGHPTLDVEEALLHNVITGFDASDLDALGLHALVDGAGLVALQACARAVRVEPPLLRYIASIVDRTRRHPAVYLGASPRASIGLLRCAQATALMEGRDYVVPDDIKVLAKSILRHRFLLQPDAELEGLTADSVVADVLTDVQVPGAQGR